MKAGRGAWPPANKGAFSPALIALVVFIITAAAAGGYFYYKTRYGRLSQPSITPSQTIPVSGPLPEPPGSDNKLMPLNIYYPKDGELQMEQRMTPAAGNL